MIEAALTILERSTAWMQAWIDRDRKVLEDSLAPDFALVVSAMPDQRIDRERWLATCDRYIATRFAYHGVQVREFGPGLAVMSAIADQQATLGDVDRSGSFFVTDLWRLEPDGEWRVCSRYSSHPEPAGGSSDALGKLGTR